MVETHQNSEVLNMLNVSYHYPNKRGVSGISIKVMKGELTLLVGRTGSGKTTMYKLIARELVPDSGEITLVNMKSSNLKGREFAKWRRHLGIVFQDLRLLNDRNVLENVRLAAECETRLPISAKARSLRVLNRVGMSHKIKDFPSELSTGEQQRVAIARALVNEPLVLLADEPVSNLDAETSSEIIEILNQVSLFGTSVLVATHQPERFEKYNPRIMRMDNGTLLAS